MPAFFIGRFYCSLFKCKNCYVQLKIFNQDINYCCISLPILLVIYRTYKLMQNFPINLELCAPSNLNMGIGIMDILHHAASAFHIAKR